MNRIWLTVIILSYFKGKLGSGVDAVEGHGNLARDGGHHDDARSLAGLPQKRQELLGAVDLADNVDVKLEANVLELEELQGTGHNDARVVHKGAKTVGALGGNSLHRGGDRLRLGHIDHNGDNLTTRGGLR